MSVKEIQKSISVW